MTADTEKRPLGVSLLVAFFWFGAAMCSLTIILLLFPGTPLDIVWRVKPTARGELAALGEFTLPLMMIVGAFCVGAAIDLARCAEWGRRVAVAVLVVNLIGDLSSAVLRADWRTLIGLPIGGSMIYYLMRPPTRRWFENRKMPVAKGAVEQKRVQAPEHSP
jgi:hypothetical protein